MSFNRRSLISVLWFPPFLELMASMNANHRPDNGRSSHLWNAGQLQREYTALYPRKVSSLIVVLQDNDYELNGTVATLDASLSKWNNRLVDWLLLIFFTVLRITLATEIKHTNTASVKQRIPNCRPHDTSNVFIFCAAVRAMQRHIG
jgi:hypothetical protein